MKLLTFVSAGALGILVASGASAEVITFEGETSGAKPNGYTVQGATFSDTIGTDLLVANFAEANGKGLEVGGIDASRLNISFLSPIASFSLTFGNDCIAAADSGQSQPHHGVLL